MKNKKKGFTLVELIVVLAILAILAAMLVPALTGYIDKANEKKYVAEARSAVVAAQTIASDYYSTRKSTDKAVQQYLIDNESDILKLAELTDKGDITTIEVNSTNGSITKLVWKSSSSSKSVVYDGSSYTLS